MTCKIKLNFMISICAAALMACGSSGGGNDSSAKVSSLNLSGAVALAVKKEATSTSSSFLRAQLDSDPSLFKILNDGTLEAIQFKDSEGNSVSPAPRATDVAQTGSDFVVVKFDDDSLILVRLSSGAAFDLSSALENGTINYSLNKIQVDSNGSLYFVASAELKKVDVSDPSNPVLSRHSASGDILGSNQMFCVDLDGNAVYEGRDSGDNGVLRYRKASGGFETLPGSPNISYTTCWLGLDNQLYYYNGSISGVNVKKLTTSEGDLLAEDYGDTSVSSGCGFEGLFSIAEKNSIIAPGGCSPAFEIYNGETDKARELNWAAFGLNDVKLAGSSDNFFYPFGTDLGTTKKLVRFDPSDNSAVTCGINGDYDIYKMVVGADDSIIFNALRLDDGAIVLGQISAECNVTINEEDLTEEFTALIRIN